MVCRHLDFDRDKIPDLVVISGDLTSYGAQKEMDVATDVIEQIVDCLKNKDPKWRKKAITGPKPPYVIMVPGNHDLEWTKDTPARKIESFAYMADRLCMHGDVLSSNYHTPKKHEVFCDFGDEANLFVYLLDSTCLGGIDDPVLKKIYKDIATFQEDLGRGGRSENELRSALDELQKATRKDPGYVTEEALLRMRST